jgi:hypothetical protein
VGGGGGAVCLVPGSISGSGAAAHGSRAAAGERRHRHVSTPQHWDGGFQGELLVTNDGSKALAGWQIVAQGGTTQPASCAFDGGACG